MRRWTGLTALLTAEAMNLLDATIVQVAGPTIHADLGGSRADIQWFSAAYTLPFAVLLVTGGRLGDVYGRRRMFRLGVAVFTVASVACALAPDVGALLAFRVVQGVAAAFVVPQTIGLVKAMFTGPAVGRALGSIGPVMGLAAVLGPVLGAVLTAAGSWRSAFLVNVPFGIAVLAMAGSLVEDRAPTRPGLDPVGTVLVVTGTGLVVYPLIHSGPRWALLGLLVLVGFVVQQRRVRRPLVERSLFRGTAFPAALAASALFFAVTTGLTLVVVLQLRLGEGMGTLRAGLSLLPWSVGLGVASFVAGAYLVPRWGARVMYAGLALLLAAVGGWALGWPLLLALALAGLGAGLFTTPFFGTALNRISPQETGSAAGLLNAVQQLGGTFGVAVLGSAYLDAGTGRALLFAGMALVAATACVGVMVRPARFLRVTSDRVIGPVGKAFD